MDDCWANFYVTQSRCRKLRREVQAFRNKFIKLNKKAGVSVQTISKIKWELIDKVRMFHNYVSLFNGIVTAMNFESSCEHDDIESSLECDDNYETGIG